MLQSFIQYRLDALLAALIVLGTMGAVRLRLRRRYKIKRVPHLAWLLLIALLIAGNWAAEFAVRQTADNSDLLATFITRADTLGCVAGLAFMVIAAVAVLSAPHQNVASQPSPLRTILDLQPECVQILSTTGDILDINPAGIDLLEVTSENFANASIIPYVAFECREKFLGMLQSVSHGYPASLQFDLISHVGTRHCIDARTVPLLSPQGRVVAALSVMRDLTALKNAQAERDRLQQQLTEVSQRTAAPEISNDVLDDMGQSLDALNAAADNVAGKLRTRKLDDLANFLTGEQDSMMSEISDLWRSVDQIKQIVATQQSFASSTRAETVRLTDIVDEAVRIARAFLDKQNVHVERRYKDCVTVSVDRNKVVQILMNLLRNAQQANATEITIELTRVDQGDDSTARISVSDNGIGISLEHLPVLFTAGFTTKGEGHGFGLYASANGARSVGAALTAASDGLGRGATFTLDLPIHRTSDTSRSTELQEVA
jgi:PAS domain S-box-containing protein